LETRDVAEAFADVANAMIVSLSDRAVDILDNRAKLPPQEVEAASVAAVTVLADFALSAAAIFGRALPGVVIENGGIKYNGKAKKGKLETLFYNLLKKGTGMDSLKAMLSGAGGSDSAAEETLRQAEEDDQKRDGRLSCLQVR